VTRARSSLPFGFGFVDQGLSSATTFLWTVAAARILGPGGLGVVILGWTAYLGVLGLQRALVTRTLVTVSATARSDEARDAAARALALELALAATTSVAFAVVGLTAPGAVGKGLLAFSPWVGFALVQDFWRALLFRDGRARAATANDALWLVVTLALLAPAAAAGSELAVAASWGLGGAAGAVLGATQTRLLPARAGEALAWWRRDAWRLSRWLGSEAIFYSAAWTATTITLTHVLGASAIGALRAAQSLFAPLSLISPAIALPGLPAVTRAGARSLEEAFGLAARLSGLAAGLTAAYVVVVSQLATPLMPFVFGDAFRRYRYLAVPVGVWQSIVAAGVGFTILLTARRAGSALLAVRVVESGGILILAVALARSHGLAGAAWGSAAGAAGGFLAVVVSTRRSQRRAHHLAAAPGRGAPRLSVDDAGR
jgi:O-antigen/teichoic acid export membrane protein